MWFCDQSAITDRAFTHLCGLHTLTLIACNQKTITDDAFTHLWGLHTLTMQGCNQNTITDDALAHIGSRHHRRALNIDCTQFTSRAFCRLSHLRELSICECNENLGDDA